jgi:hypothetical protein
MENNFFKKHIDTIVILTAFASSVLWMNSKFNEIDSRFSAVEKDIAVMKAVLLMKNILPAELAHKVPDESTFK